MFWKRLPSFIMLGLTLGVVFVFSQSLNGCALQNGPVARWVSSWTGGYGLSAEAIEELERFHQVFNERAVENEDREREFQAFVEAYKVVRANYVKQVDDVDLINFAIASLNDKDQSWAEEDDGTPKGMATAHKVVEVALEGMLLKLDPHSGYMTPTEFAELMVDTSGEFGGLGIEVQQGEGFIKVVSPIEDTPADRAGLKPGDKITHVNGESIKEWNLVKTVRHLRGKPGSSVVVTIDRENVTPFDVSIVRDIIQVRAVRSAIYDDYLHLRVTAFSERMEIDVLKAFDQARSQLGDGLKGVVLDLRNNPGGLLQQSVALADVFLEEGNVVQIRGRNEGQIRSYNADSGDLAKGLPVVVLINGGSASASEIVSGALQDHNRAILMGRRTFGKGSVQTIMPLPEDGAVKLTTALYYLPSGRTIQQVGVAPDILLKVPEKKETPETALKEGEEKTEHKAPFSVTREADYPNVLNAYSLKKQETGYHKEGGMGQAEIESCPVVGPREDRELGCALEFLKAGSAKKFIAGLSAQSGKAF